ncbi:MAG TPA: hypothetical protein VFW03_24035 [Gemmatimonadaceae bacterium]|nr:hypothetical protein [Gemmatimonadaceae bacterium]
MRRSKQTAVVARSVSVLVVVSVLVASGWRAASAQVPSDPCAQVTPAEVSAALGETVTAGQQAGTKTCSWSAEKPTHEIVSLMYSPPGDWNTRKTREMPGVTRTTVSGIGDEAFAETAGNLTTLYVKKGSTIFMVRVYGVPDVGRQLAIEKPIAEKVAAKV